MNNESGDSEKHRERERETFRSTEGARERERETFSSVEGVCVAW